MTTILRPLSTSELLDRTFHLYRNNFVMFIGIAALPQVGVFALHITDSTLWFRHLVESRAVRVAIVYIASFVALEISHAVTAMAVSNLHLGRSSDILSAYSLAKSSLLRVLGISLVTFVLPFVLGIIIGIAAVAVSAGLLGAFGVFSSGIGKAMWIRIGVILLVFLAAPLLSVRWWIRWSLVVPVAVLEGAGLRSAMRRSRSLIEGHGGRVFTVFLLVVALTWTVGIVLQTPFYSMIQWRGFLCAARISNTAVIVSAAGNFVSNSLVAPLLTIALTLIYYDERVRKEGFDLQLMISTLERAPQPAAAPSIS